MNAWRVLSIKEFRESWRSYKLLWIPLLFLFLGVSEPLTNYYMMDILQAVGNVPEGLDMLFPELRALDVLLATTEQFQLIGIIVLIAVFVGTVSRERANGTATLIYIRPVSPASIFLSKWAIASAVAVWSAAWGYCGSIYYTAVLYGKISFADALAIVGTYAVWLLFVMALAVAMSAAFSTAVAATLTITLVPIGGMIDGLLGAYWNISPWKLARYGIMAVDGSLDSGYYWSTLLLTVGLTIILLGFGIWMTGRNRQLAQM